MVPIFILKIIGSNRTSTVVYGYILIWFFEFIFYFIR